MHAPCMNSYFCGGSQHASSHPRRRYSRWRKKQENSFLHSRCNRTYTVGVFAKRKPSFQGPRVGGRMDHHQFLTSCVGTTEFSRIKERTARFHLCCLPFLFQVSLIYFAKEMRFVMQSPGSLSAKGRVSQTVAGILMLQNSTYYKKSRMWHT